MNLSDLRESNYETKREGGTDGSKIAPKPNLTTSTWSRLKDPRIVRVSRAFGGKDRHSKVCTVKGLRDRRVRLSVPTAIQLYDLQERLGLNQPSKVVDWLLDVAKHEIDELPPLQIPPGTFLQEMLNVSSSQYSERIEGVKSNPSGLNWEDYWKKTSEDCEENDQEEGRTKVDHHDAFVQSGNFFERNPNSSNNLPGLMNSVVPNSSFLKWDPSNLSLSQFRSYGSVTPHQHDDDTVHNFNMNVGLIPSGSQLFLYPPHQPPPQTQSYFPPHNHDSCEFDPKQVNFPHLYTINQGMRPFQLSMNPKFFSSDDNGGHEPNQ